MTQNILETGRKLAEEYHRDSGKGFPNEGRKNAYVCDGEGGTMGLPRKAGCGAYIVTIDRAPGVTPFGIECGSCGQFAHSKMYRVKPELEPTHEWYRPDDLQGIDPRYYDHLSRGGLILRAIPGKPDQWQSPEPSDQAAYELSERAAAMAKQSHAMRDALIERQIKSRQVRRAEARKSPEPPQEITMYGRLYRLAD